jgi:60 kDa SS-A/Ro ribonucleoprotein
MKGWRREKEVHRFTFVKTFFSKYPRHCPMSRFNTAQKRVQPDAVNLAGGQAFAESPKLEFAGLLLTSMLKEQFYRTATDQLKRIQDLALQLDPQFVAKTAIFARRDNHMRSVSHVAMGELFRKVNGKSRVSGEEWVKRALDKVILRPDDAQEIMAYYESQVADSKAHPNQLRKGVALALDKFDEYQLAKYRGEGKDVSLVDIVNIVHPGPKSLYGKVVKGELKNTKTFESKLSAAGQVQTEGKTEEEIEEIKSTNKKEAWGSLLHSGQIGYFALVKNLRNILEQAPEHLDVAIKLLTDENRIAKSRILPYRFITAVQEIENHFISSDARRVVMALADAIDIACKNAPEFEGRTLIAVDNSGSMSGSVKDVAGLFAAVLAKTNNADVMLFDDRAEWPVYNPKDSVVTNARKFANARGGTDFNCIFRSATQKYDRIIILSDMQAWVGYNVPKDSFSDYKRRTGANPKIYSFNLQDYGTIQFPETNVYAIAGFSDKALDLMEKLEVDRNALINEIEAIEL